MKAFLSHITDATVDTFATCGFNFRMRKYAQCGPRLMAMQFIAELTFQLCSGPDLLHADTFLTEIIFIAE